MRWSYKTVHYALKKEGLLGSAFLDESEIEQSLNEYGKAGWELVSLLETTDGVIGVFKQPLDLGRSSAASISLSPPAAARPAAPGVKQEILRMESAREDYLPEINTVDEFEVVEEQEQNDDPPQVDVGSIRIE